MLVRRILYPFALFIFFGNIGFTNSTSRILRPRRSVAPFLGAGGSHPDDMRIKRNDWHCGSDGYTRNYTHKEVATKCPSLAAALNHCCAVHDDCYGQQLGQDICDQQFCECNRMATRLPTEEGYKCRGMLEDACLILQFMGGFAYDVSNYTDPTKPSNIDPVAPISVPNIEKDYLRLYETCPFVNITLASCSFNFDLCANVHSVDFCAVDLCHCILDASESDVAHNKSCAESVAHTCRRVLKHSSEILATQSSYRFNIMLIGFLCIALSVVGYAAYVYWKNNRNIQTEENKFVHIHSVESSKSVNPLLSNSD